MKIPSYRDEVAETAGGRGKLSAAVRLLFVAAMGVCYNWVVKFTRYSETIRLRPDRAEIKLEWIDRSRHEDQIFPRY